MKSVRQLAGKVGKSHPTSGNPTTQHVVCSSSPRNVYDPWRIELSTNPPVLVCSVLDDDVFISPLQSPQNRPPYVQELHRNQTLLTSTVDLPRRYMVMGDVNCCSDWMIRSYAASRSAKAAEGLSLARSLSAIFNGDLPTCAVDLSRPPQRRKSSAEQRSAATARSCHRIIVHLISTDRSRGDGANDTARAMNEPFFHGTPLPSFCADC